MNRRYFGEGATRGPLPIILSWALGGFLFWVGGNLWVTIDDALDVWGDD